MRKQTRRLLWGLLTLIITGAMIVFAIAPTFIAKRLNPTNPSAIAVHDRSTLDFHRQLVIADLHGDSLLWGRDLAKRDTVGHVDIPRLIEGNVALQVFAVVTKVPSPLKLQGNSDRTDDIIKLALIQRWPVTAWFRLRSRALYQAGQLFKLERQASKHFTVIETAGDLREYLVQRESDSQQTTGLLALEGAQALEGKLENVDRLYEAGFRMIGLTHFFDNEVGGSGHGLTGEGLTEFGQDVIRRMEALGMIVDLAHASPQLIDDVLEVSSKPIVVSHTGVKGTCDNSRNLSDAQLTAIAQTGGVIGIGYWEPAVCGQGVEDIVKAIRYTVDLVGVEHVGLGSDFDGSTRMPFDVSEMIQLTDGLKNSGLGNDEIEAIMGGNVIQLFSELLPR